MDESMNFAPRCPYCGEEMRESGSISHRWYMCPYCLSAGPGKIIDVTGYPNEELAVVDATQKAREAAMKHWQEPNAPLTLGELIEYSKNLSNAPVWYEYRGLSEVGCWINVEVVRDNYCDCSEDEYGKQWRFWPHKPTLEEMEAAPWAEN